MMEPSAEAVLLETERLVLRQFTMSDAGNLADLHADPDVTRLSPEGGHVARRDQGQPPARVHGLVPSSGGYGCWAANQETHRGVPRDGSGSILAAEDRPGRSSSGTGSASRLGDRAMPRKDHAP